MWLVDNKTDKVFKYTLAGTLVGSWTITTSGASSPTGITIDPTNVSDIWIVDSFADAVFQYTAAASRTSGSHLQIVYQEGPNFALVIGSQGNSFSGPHAAGVAALMLSANPELPAWQVKSLLEQTCTDLGPPGRDNTFGAGLLNALEAVRATKRQGK